MPLADDTALIISPALKQRAQNILEALKASQLSIVTAESCTAGTVAAILSRADGAGDLLHGGFVTYTKEQKTKALGVSAQLLEEHGAVNEAVVRQLATGALQRSPANISLAVSGVLGPEEDEDGNPVGLVYFCAMAKDGAGQIAREDWGKQSPEQLLRLAIHRAFDLIETVVKGTDGSASRAP
jgi:nicotinamide-nucleotide amidase